jgi:hypothetical protein
MIDVHKTSHKILQSYQTIDVSNWNFDGIHGIGIVMENHWDNGYHCWDDMSDNKWRIIR